MSGAAVVVQLKLPTPSSQLHRQHTRCSIERQLLFNRIASVYDKLNDLLSLGQHRIWKRMDVSWSRVQVGDKVLDVCCRSGDLSFLLSDKVGSSGKVFY